MPVVFKNSFNQFVQFAAGLVSNFDIGYTKGPDALGKFLFILQKYLSSFSFYKCEQCFPFHQNFVKSHQTSKAPSSCLGAGQSFVKGENCQILQFAGVNLNKNVNQVKFDLAFKESIQAEARLFFFFRDNRTVMIGERRR